MENQWEAVGEWSAIKRIRQGEMYLYVYVDKDGAPVFSHMTPVAQVESKATPGKLPLMRWQIFREAIATLFSWFESEYVDATAEAPDEDPDEDFDEYPGANTPEE